METLPIEVVEIIAKHLKVKDLASCCAVSPWWREVFGSDRVWKSHCNVDLEEHLRITPCRVEPKFSSPDCEKTTLSPIGRWRIAYMRETHLYRNWIGGNFVEEKFNDFAVYDDYDSVTFLNNDLVVFGKSDTIELRDTTVNPPACLAQLPIPPNYGPYDVLVIKSNRFITMSRSNIVLVVNVDLQSYNLTLQSRFNVVTVREGDFISNPYEYVFLNSVLLSKCRNCIDIWNLENGTELKKVEAGNEGKFGCIFRSTNCEDVAIVKIINESFFVSTKYQFLVYNTYELRFWPFVEYSSNCHYSGIINSYIALFINGKAAVYNYKTSHLILSIPMSTFNYYPIQAARNSFLLINGYELLQVFPSSGDIRRISVHTEIYRTRFISNKLCLLFGGDMCVRFLWKVGSTPISFSPQIPDKMAISCKNLRNINPACSKMLSKILLREGRSIEVECLNFW